MKKKLILLAACIKPLLLQPSLLGSTLWEIAKRGKSGGLIAVKVALLQVREGKLLTSNKALWQRYQYQLHNEIKPVIVQQIKDMPELPLISVLIPTYNTSPEFLSKTIQSIKKQWYPNWQLCICDDASTDIKTLALLKKESEKESRIQVHFSSHNRNISGATNKALSMAQGDYVVFLDHDDLLQPQALFRISQAIIKQQADFIYSDEARITKKDDEVLDYFLRPQFSLERLRSTPYIVHFICFRTQFLRDLGGLNEELTISQDYDLILRAVERTRHIVHIPEILYLWRTLSNSAGHKMQHKVMATSKQILEQHLQRCQQQGHIEQSEFFNFFRIRYPLKAKLNVAIIIPTKNCADLVKQCIDSFERSILSVKYEIVLIDHDSDEQESIDYFSTLKKKYSVLHYQGEFNFSALNNFAVAQLTDKHFSHYLFCNNDIEAIEEAWLEQMLELVQQEDVAIVGPKLLYPDKKKIQHAGVGIGIFSGAEHYAKFLESKLPDGRVNPGHAGILLCNQEVSAVTAACLLIKSDVFHQINGFDEQFAVGFGDADLCLRVRAMGKRVIFTPHVSLLHYESYSRGLHNEHPEDTQLFKYRWDNYMQHGDPYFNPNFSKQSYCWDMESPLPITSQTLMRSSKTVFQAKK